MTPQQRIRRAMDNAQGDNLERAEHAFRGLSEKQMNDEHGSSGKTRKQLLEEYRQERREWQVASDMLDSLLASVPTPAH